MTTPTLPDFDAWWDYDAPAETEQKFRDLLPVARAAGDEEYVAQLLTQIARTEGLQRRFDAAHATLDEVAQSLPARSAQTRVRYLLERGRAFNSSKKKAEARALFLEAWELARANGEDGYAVDAAHMMAIVEPTDAQHEWNQKALDLAEQSTQPRARKWRGSLYNNMGWTYHDEGKYEEALATFQKALQAREEAGEPKNIRIAQWCVARVTRSLGQYEDALAMQRQLLAATQTAGEQEDGYISEELGENLLALNRGDEARPHFAQAYAKLSQDPWFVENEAARLARLKALGEV